MGSYCKGLHGCCVSGICLGACLGAANPNCLVSSLTLSSPFCRFSSPLYISCRYRLSLSSSRACSLMLCLMLSVGRLRGMLLCTDLINTILLDTTPGKFTSNACNACNASNKRATSTKKSNNATDTPYPKRCDMYPALQAPQKWSGNDVLDSVNLRTHSMKYFKFRKDTGLGCSTTLHQ